MQLRFNIGETIETEIYYGFYTIYILGGHYVKVNPNFFIQIVNLETNQEVELTEKYLKPRDYKLGQKAISFYTFEVSEYGKFKISVHNLEDIVVKNSMLETFPFPFSLPHIISSSIMGKSRKEKPISSIDILIE